LKPNILFIVIDSFQAKKCFGNNKTSVTPNIDSLINNGSYFSQTISAASSTVLSFGSIFTGLYPFDSVTREDNYFKINFEKNIYIKNLIDFGYNAFATVPQIFTFVGLEKIFGKQIQTYESFSNLYNGVGEQILNNLNSKHLEEPWLYYLHLMDLHGNETSFLSDPPSKFTDKKYGINRYDQMISAMDVWLGKILKKINLDNTIIILTADHGADSASWTPEMEKFAQYNIDNRKVEPGTVNKLSMKIPKSIIPFRKKLSVKYREKRNQEIENKITPEMEKIQELDLTPYQKRIMESAVGSIPNVFEEMCHVPLIISGYNIPNKIIPELVSSIDIFPTIAEIVKMPKKDIEIHGKSLLPLIECKDFEERPVYLESDIKSTSKNNIIGIRTSKYKYFRNGDSLINQNLYDLENDILEEKNLATQNLDIVEKMEKILEQLKNKSSIITNQKQIDDDKRKKIQEELKKLGYIS
jgi:arylsulfatase A-like enzyme